MVQLLGEAAPYAVASLCSLALVSAVTKEVTPERILSAPGAFERTSTVP